MPVDPNKSKRVALSLPIDVADKVQQLADKERRSVSSWLRNAVEDRVNADWTEIFREQMPKD